MRPSPAGGIGALSLCLRFPVPAGAVGVQHVSDLSLAGITVTDSRGLSPHSMALPSQCEGTGQTLFYFAGLILSLLPLSCKEKVLSLSAPHTSSFPVAH